MAERIYIRSDGGGIEPLEEEPFSTEDELQALIAEHPELLDGEQIRPGDPRRWILHCPGERNRRNLRLRRSLGD